MFTAYKEMNEQIAQRRGRRERDVTTSCGIRPHWFTTVKVMSLPTLTGYAPAKHCNSFRSNKEMTIILIMIGENDVIKNNLGVGSVFLAQPLKIIIPEKNGDAELGHSCSIWHPPVAFWGQPWWQPYEQRKIADAGLLPEYLLPGAYFTKTASWFF